MSSTFISSINSPLGIICIHASDIGIIRVDINKESKGQKNEWTIKAAQQLQEYFHDDRREFDLQYDFNGRTAFQQLVWQELLKIPFGKTISYMDIALALNNKGAIRAVGAANGANPIGIIIPCHRVIGSDGSLTGYANGIKMKRWLLEHEGAIEPEKQLKLF